MENKITTTTKTFLSNFEKHTEYYLDGELHKTVVTKVGTGEHLFDYYPNKPKQMPNKKLQKIENLIKSYNVVVSPHDPNNSEQWAQVLMWKTEFFDKIKHLIDSDSK